MSSFHPRSDAKPPCLLPEVKFSEHASLRHRISLRECSTTSRQSSEATHSRQDSSSALKLALAAAAGCCVRVCSRSRLHRFVDHVGGNADEICEARRLSVSQFFTALIWVILRGRIQHEGCYPNSYCGSVIARASNSVSDAHSLCYDQWVANCSGCTLSQRIHQWTKNLLSTTRHWFCCIFRAQETIHQARVWAHTSGMRVLS